MYPGELWAQFFDMLLGCAVELVDFIVEHDLAAVFAEASGIIALEILATTAAVHCRRNSNLIAAEDSLGRTTITKGPKALSFGKIHCCQ